jgi:hypothetical protein
MDSQAQIAIQISQDEWAHVYVHLDGHPSHMLPALKHWKPEDILSKKEIRRVTPDKLDGINAPSDPRIMPLPKCEYSYLYMWIGSQWLRVVSQTDSTKE